MKRGLRQQISKAFSLIETIAAMAVLLLLMVFVFQVFAIFNRSWQDGRARVDNFSKARALLDLISYDLQNGVFRADISKPQLDVDIAGTRCAIVLYTRRQGSDNAAAGQARSVSLVVYSLDKARAVLRRGDIPLTWDNSAQSMHYGELTGFPLAASSTMNLLDAAPGVLAFSVQFIDPRDEVQATYVQGKSSASVTLAVVDEMSTRVLRENGSMSTLTASPVWAAPGAGESAGTKKAWENGLTPEFWKDYPEPVRRSLRIFERRIALP